MRCRYNAVNFLQNYHKIISLARTRYMVFFVSINYDACSASVTVLLSAKSYDIGPRCNDTWLYAYLRYYQNHHQIYSVSKHILGIYTAHAVLLIVIEIRMCHKNRNIITHLFSPLANYIYFTRYGCDVKYLSVSIRYILNYLYTPGSHGKTTRVQSLSCSKVALWPHCCLNITHKTNVHCRNIRVLYYMMLWDHASDFNDD